MTPPTQTPPTLHIPRQRVIDSRSWIGQSTDENCLHVTSLGHCTQASVSHSDTRDGVKGASYYPPSAPPVCSYSYPVGRSRSGPQEAAYQRESSSHGACSHTYPSEQNAPHNNGVAPCGPPPSMSSSAANHPLVWFIKAPHIPIIEQYAAHHCDVQYLRPFVQKGDPTVIQHNRPGARSYQSVEQAGDIRDSTSEMGANVVAAGKLHGSVKRSAASHAPDVTACASSACASSACASSACASSACASSACASSAYASSACASSACASSACASPLDAGCNLKPSKNHSAITHSAVSLENSETSHWSLSKMPSTLSKDRGGLSQRSILKLSKPCTDRRHPRSARFACKHTQRTSGNTSKRDSCEQSAHRERIDALRDVVRAASFMCDPVQQSIHVTRQHGQYSTSLVFRFSESSGCANMSHKSTPSSTATLPPSEAVRPRSDLTTSPGSHCVSIDSNRDVVHDALSRSVPVSSSKAHLPDALRTHKKGEMSRATSRETIESQHTTVSLLLDSLLTGMSVDELRSPSSRSQLWENRLCSDTLSTMVLPGSPKAESAHLGEFGCQLASALCELKHTGTTLQSTEQQFYDWVRSSSPTLRKASVLGEIALPAPRDETPVISRDDSQNRMSCANPNALDNKMAAHAGVHDGGVPATSVDEHHDKDHVADENRTEAYLETENACDRSISAVSHEEPSCNVDASGTSTKARRAAKSPKRLRPCLSQQSAHCARSNQLSKSVIVASESPAPLLVRKSDSPGLGFHRKDEREYLQKTQTQHASSFMSSKRLASLAASMTFTGSPECKSNTSADLLASTLHSGAKTYAVTQEKSNTSANLLASTLHSGPNSCAVMQEKSNTSADLLASTLHSGAKSYTVTQEMSNTSADFLASTLHSGAKSYTVTPEKSNPSADLFASTLHSGAKSYTVTQEKSNPSADLLASTLHSGAKSYTVTPEKSNPSADLLASTLHSGAKSYTVTQEKSNPSADLFASTLRSGVEVKTATLGDTAILSQKEMVKDHFSPRALSPSECYPGSISQPCSPAFKKMPEDSSTYRALCASEIYRYSSPLVTFQDPSRTPVLSGLISTRQSSMDELSEDPASFLPASEERVSRTTVDPRRDRAFAGESSRPPSSLSANHSSGTRVVLSLSPETHGAAVGPLDRDVGYNDKKVRQSEDIIVRVMDKLVAMSHRALAEQSELLSGLGQNRKSIDIEAQHRRTLEKETKVWKKEIEAHVRVLEARITTLEKQLQKKT